MARTSDPPAETGRAFDLAVQQRMLKALAHPIRMRALIILNERVASPSEIAEELGESLGVVAYHMRTLEQLQCIELVRREQRRGAVEHYYRALERPWITDEELEQLPDAMRRGLSASIFKHLIEDVAHASTAEGLARADHCMMRAPVLLDQQAWDELKGLIDDLFERALELQAETMNRLIASGEDDSIAAILGLQLFERRTVEHDRRLKSATAPAKPTRTIPVPDEEKARAPKRK
jgi:DNA-binding transcriptional ArsR family regulator